MLLLVGSCSSGEDDRSARQAAQAFETQAENCLLDVRDHGQSYDSSLACRRLGDVSKRYVEATSADPANIPDDIELKFEQGLRQAWIAKALSLADEADRSSLSLW